MQFGLPEMYVMGKAEYIKTVFSGENDGTTSVASNRIMAMREYNGSSRVITDSRQQTVQLLSCLQCIIQLYT